MAHGIEDVARVAGVSTATVSRALRGLPNVAPATRDHVREVASRLGYSASPSAASLASGRTRTIGVLSPWISHWFFANVIEGAERALRASDFDALLHTFELFRGGPRRRVDPVVLRRRVDGILVVGLPLAADEVADLSGLDVPIVFVGSGPPGQILVRLDDRLAARTATEHLIELGHRRIAHVTGDPGDVLPWSPAEERLVGWRSAMTEAGLPVPDELEVHGYFDVPGARETATRLLTQHPDITAVFAASDEMAMGVVLAAADLGLRVPQDVSVIGIDGHDLGDLIGLTTVAQDAAEQGVRAATMLLDLVAGGVVPQVTTFPTRLVIRRTTGAVPVR
ncbi:LacI family DNA-binding transcriptional regulator [Cellulomonas edaphi]|uniref:LacI family DNA-binding transcriptional regulator n=1 Tax=Cellulomonas edaphi TaxID=3053468 RepID=A0ABT7S361_9CELL|nr:LacI family DNA-binding transcriptional regulator [Cellulomons edaphi]MDM7830058.1 LacI family DNA-binding transcriptional regulator [Cellulomons edaphi]